MRRERQFAIAFGVAALFAILVYYGVQIFRPLPEIHEDVVVSLRITPTTPEGWKAREKEDSAKEEDYQNKLKAIDRASQPFFRALIFVATPLGIAAIVVGSYLRVQAIGIGLILGGILIITRGYWGYWDHLENWFRFVSVLLGICILGFVGYCQLVMARNRST